jgi:hypothetical protein
VRAVNPPLGHHLSLTATRQPRFEAWLFAGRTGMAAAGLEARRTTRRRWAVVVVLSPVFHVLVLAGFAFRMPALQPYAEPQAMDVSLVAPPPFIRPLAIETAKPPPKTRVVILDAPPRYAPQKAPTGEAGDATDLFGPVFADGLWPRPVLVHSEPCDPKDDPEAAETCRRELLLIGLASDGAAGAKAQP